MKLKEYLIVAGYRTPWFAQKMGVSYNSLCNWLSGKARPHHASIELIKMHTNGKVTEKDWEADPKMEEKVKNDKRRKKDSEKEGNEEVQDKEDCSKIEFRGCLS